MSIKYIDKIKLVLESVEEAVDKKIIEEDTPFAAAGRYDPQTKTSAPPSGKGLHTNTANAIKTLMGTLSQVLKSGLTPSLTADEIKTQVNTVMFELKTEKARGDIKAKYAKELEELEKDTAKKAAPSKSGGTAKVQKPAKAAEKTSPAKPKEEVKGKQTEEKRDPKAAEKNQKSKDDFNKNKKTFEDPRKK